MFRISAAARHQLRMSKFWLDMTPRQIAQFHAATVSTPIIPYDLVVMCIMLVTTQTCPPGPGEYSNHRILRTHVPDVPTHPYAIARLLPRQHQHMLMDVVPDALTPLPRAQDDDQ